MRIIGRLNMSIYSKIYQNLITDEVILTPKQIQHIFDGHPEKHHENIFERLAESVFEPDYILEDDDPRTAVILKYFICHEERYRIILKLAASSDLKHPKNSIITAFYISEKKWNKYLRNKKILYSREKE